jgi:tetratricopeptide (TPR) repeat protein
MQLRTFLFAAGLTIFSLSSALPAEPESEKIARQGAEAVKAKDWNRAVNEFRRAAEMDHKYAQNYFAALVQRGATYREQQKFQEALADFTEALKIKPNDADTYERRAYVYMQVKEYDKALADYTASLKADPKEARVYLLRSYIYEVKGDARNGIADCDMVLKLQPGNQEAQARKDRLMKRMNMPPTPPPTPAGPIANPNYKPGATATPTPAKR